ncbi:flagellar hook-associated protein 3 [Comamonas kerstersii]|nr:flagellar hook-associated protein 3 [Comamonas kerstersii]OOH95048.1 flagellar hook-associated protein 3 [Comamonas kerstersii]
MYDRTIRNIGKQQAELASQMEHASAGKRVIRASDDPVAAAQAERARTRLSRIETDQRQLEAQKATITYAESTLGEINGAMQDFRGLLVQAGNGSYNQTQRDTLVEQLQSLRKQILNYVNRTDSNGLPLFRGLDTNANQPFPNGGLGIQTGQTNSNAYTITNSLDGGLAFFSGVTGNGVLSIGVGANNQGTAHTNVGVITDADAAYELKESLNTLTQQLQNLQSGGTSLPASIRLPLSAEIVFSEDTSGALQYQVRTPTGIKTWDPSTAAAGETEADYPQVVYSESAAAPFKSGADIQVLGMNITVSGDPKAGDSFQVAASAPQSIFDTLDAAIRTVQTAGNTDGSTKSALLTQGLTNSLAEIDTQLNRISSVRGLAGDLLNQADRMNSSLLALNEQVESQRSAAEDIDAVAALSQLKTQETAVSAALQSYASIQKLSLFNYIG